MLPAAKPGATRLADVLPAQLRAMRGEPNVLGLPRARRAVIVVVDGLGSANLSAAAGHARTLARATGKGIQSGFPTTTAVALTSLTTGTQPGVHGIVGYDALVPGEGVMNQLRDWGGAMDPATWQRSATLFAEAPSFAVNEPRFVDSGFTRATLRDASYVPARTIDDRIESTLEVLASERDALVYCYLPEVDRAGHEHGWRSGAWTDALEAVDGAVAALVAGAPPDTGILVTADHGMVDVRDEDHRIVPPSLRSGIAHVAGEPRCLQLHVEAGVEPAAVAAAWEAAYGDVAWVATRDELVASGWLGPVDAAVLPRIGDVVVAARALVAFYVDESDPARSMIGQHGSLSQEELRVPVIRLGAYAA